MGTPGRYPSSTRLAVVALAAALALSGSPASAGADPQADAKAAPSPATVTVTVDNAKVIRLPDRAQTVVVGNPFIADITIQKNGIVVVTGKAFGVTNLIALDATGSLLAESTIRVQAASEAVVTVQRGLERESYSCTPKCQPSAQLGDSTTYFDQVSGQSGKRNGLATSK